MKEWDIFHLQSNGRTQQIARVHARTMRGALWRGLSTGNLHQIDNGEHKHYRHIKERLGHRGRRIFQKETIKAVDLAVGPDIVREVKVS